MTKMVKRLAALIMSTLILSVLFATSAFAQENLLTKARPSNCVYLLPYVHF